MTGNFARRGRARIVERDAGYGDASACQKLRIPLIRRDPRGVTSNPVPAELRENDPKTVSAGPERPEQETDG